MPLKYYREDPLIFNFKYKKVRRNFIDMHGKLKGEYQMFGKHGL